MQLQAPKAGKKPHILRHHGHDRVDAYYWLREKENEDVLAYLRSENEYTKAIMAHTKNLQQVLYEEIKGRIKQTDISVPYKKDGYYFYNRQEDGKDYHIYCRKKENLDAPEEILIDCNELAKGLPFFSLSALSLSPEKNILAYSTDLNGNRISSLQFKNLDTGNMLPDVLPEICQFTWAGDQQTIYYSVYDDALRSYKIFRHIIGRPFEQDEEIYHEEDVIFWYLCL